MYSSYMDISDMSFHSEVVGITIVQFDQVEVHRTRWRALMNRSKEALLRILAGYEVLYFVRYGRRTFMPLPVITKSVLEIAICQSYRVDR